LTLKLVEGELPERTLDGEVAERALVGAVFHRADVLTTSGVQPEHFADGRLQHVWRVMGALHTRGQPVDTTTVAAELEREERLGAVGGLGLLMELEDRSVTADTSSYFADQVRRSWLTRRAKSEFNDLANAGLEADDLIDDAWARLLKLQAQAGRRDGRCAASAERLRSQRARRESLVARELRFGVSFLDECLGGILPNDLVVLGAPTGTGKTQITAAIAQANASRGRKVKFFALEAETNEIEMRMLYRRLAHEFFLEAYRYRFAEVQHRLSYAAWYRGHLQDVFAPFEERVTNELAAEMATLSTSYLDAAFTLDDLRREVLSDPATQLVVVDHLDFVETGDRDELRSAKEVMKGLRDIVLRSSIPVIVVAHLRKKDRHQGPVPGLEEFHGSSHITKLATKCVLMAPAPRDTGADPTLWETFMHAPKDRMGGATGYVAKLIYDIRMQAYQPRYVLGRIAGEEWSELAPDSTPSWYRGGRGA
jgi:replicative DNA helicase